MNNWEYMNSIIPLFGYHIGAISVMLGVLLGMYLHDMYYHYRENKLSAAAFKKMLETFEFDSEARDQYIATVGELHERLRMENISRNSAG